VSVTATLVALVAVVAVVAFVAQLDVPNKDPVNAVEVTDVNPVKEDAVAPNAILVDPTIRLLVAN
jgi:uncharacterized protein YcfJ